MNPSRLAHLRDQTTWRAQATSCLRWIVFFVREARRAEADGNRLGARLAWRAAWRRFELRVECERWGAEE